MHNIQTSIEQTPITISVILPVYNVAPWIGECIESLKKQTLPGLEFIFVDDCSTDGSRDIIEAFAAEDPRVRILQNEVNSGSGPSRNAGIEAAQGEYYSFIDPDDWVCDNFYELLYGKAQETGCDIIKGVRIAFKDRDDISHRTATKKESALNNRIRLLLKRDWPLYNGFTYEHQSAIFKASLFEDENVRYGSSRVAQDVTFLLKVCYDTTSIAFQEEAIYYYRRREGAATSSYTIKRAMTHILSMEESLAYLKTKEGFLSRHQISYINVRLKGYHSIFYYASKDEFVSTQAYEKYYQRFSQMIESIGGSAPLKSGFQELDVYLNYKHLIPCSIRKDGIVFTDGMEGWTDFLVQHPDLKNKDYYSGYATAMLRSGYSFFRAVKNKGFRESWLRFCKEQFSRLSPYDKRRVLTQVSARGFSTILRRMGL